MPKRTRSKQKTPHTTFHLISLFPESISSYITSSIIGRAIQDNYIRVKTYNPRDFATDKLKHIDKPPYGGGPGMVLEALPFIRAVEKACAYIKRTRSTTSTRSTTLVWLSPSGIPFNTAEAQKLSKQKHIVFISGRYEGIDARVKDVFSVKEYSVGPYTLTGGELPALVMMDAISRQIPGILGNTTSLEESRTASPDTYTRPETFTYKGKTYRVPAILLSGNHKDIETWKMKQKKTSDH